MPEIIEFKEELQRAFPRGLIHLHLDRAAIQF